MKAKKNPSPAHAQAHDDASRTRLSRRGLLSSSATLAAASLLSGQASASSRRGSGRPVLVQVFMRLGMDGLTTVVPWADGSLYNLRPTLAVPPPGSASGALDLDGFFGLAPSAAPLLTPWSDGRLAIVHACGSDDTTRSHFEAFERMEFADTAGIITSGWITRYLNATAASATGSLRAIGATTILPLSLRGAPRTLPVPDFENFSFPGTVVSAPQRLAAISDTYGRVAAPVGPAALDTIASFGLGGIDFAGYTPENGAQYPNTPFGARMRSVAALIKGDIGVEAFSVDILGWDLHANLGPISGMMARLIDELTRTLEAFYLDLLAYADDYVLVAMSEFGRHVRENSSNGVDHGHGNAMFVMGGHVNGGQVIADWPGLTIDDLDNGDLAITIDYRDILGEILRERMGLANLSTIFPLHTFQTYGVTA